MVLDLFLTSIRKTYYKYSTNHPDKCTQQAEEFIMSTTQSHYDRLRGALLSKNPSSAPSASLPYKEEKKAQNRASEASPLLSILKKSDQHGSYRAIPPPSSRGNAPTSDLSTFRPTEYAEQALEALTNGILLKVLFSIIGMATVGLKLDSILNVPWVASFGPFWIGNLILLFAHVSAIKSTWKLKYWAEADALTNEPLLPLLKRVLALLCVTVPVSLLVLWSEVAFCVRFSSSASIESSAAGVSNLYMCYAPLLVIETAFVVRYLLCRSESHLPGVAWLLVLIFTSFLAYQTNSKWQEDELQEYESSETKNSHHHLIYHQLFRMKWWIVLAPLFAFDFMMTLAVCVILYFLLVGLYRFKIPSKQVPAFILYMVFLVLSVTGQCMYVVSRKTRTTLPAVLIFSGLFSGAIGIYIVAREYVRGVLASRGGAVPVPLHRTEDGWVLSNAEVDRWLLLGDLEITEKGRDYWNRRTRADGSSAGFETDAPSNALTSWFFSWWRGSAASRSTSTTTNAAGVIGTGMHRDSLIDDSEQRLIQKQPPSLARKHSGSYEQIFSEDEEEYGVV